MIENTTKYYIESISIKLDNLINSDKSLKWLQENSCQINMSFWNIIEAFYSKYITSVYKMYRYVLSPEWGESSKDYRMRFLIIDINNDYVFIPLKIVHPIGHITYIILSMEPISYYDNKNNIIQVLEVLKSFDCIKYISIPENTPKDVVDNNYFNLKENFNYMDRSVWRSKRGINTLSRLVKFHVNVEISPKTEDDVYNLNLLWNDIKLSKNSKFKTNKNTDKRLVQLSRRYDSLYVYGFYYNNKLIGYSIASRIIGKYVSLLSTKQVTGYYSVFSTYINEDSENAKKIYKHLSSYMQYCIHKDIFEKGYEAVFNYGDVKVKGLKEFKKDYYKNVLIYNKYLLKDYLERLKNESSE